MSPKDKERMIRFLNGERDIPWWIKVCSKAYKGPAKKPKEVRQPVRYWTVTEWANATEDEKRGR